MSRLVYIKDSVTLSLNKDKCSGCKMCTIVCPHNVFAVIDKKAAIINRDFCMECGACKMNCPEGAISVRSGVGCAAGIIAGMLNKTDSDCFCSSQNSSCC